MLGYGRRSSDQGLCLILSLVAEGSYNLPTSELWAQNVRGRSRFLNPKDVDGNILRCNICDSICHFGESCPEGWENVNKVNEDGEAWDVNLSVGAQQVFMCETINAAISYRLSMHENSHWTCLERYILRTQYCLEGQFSGLVVK